MSDDQDDREFDDVELDDLEYLDAETGRRIQAIRVGSARAMVEKSVELATVRARIHDARTALNKALRLAQTAAADLVEFDASIGAQAIRNAFVLTFLTAVMLVAGAAAEAYFAFNRVRYGAGQLGAVDSPFEDPLSLLGAVVVGAFSALAAHVGGTALAESERSVMREPHPADLAATIELPETVIADPANDTLSEPAVQPGWSSAQALDDEAYRLGAIPRSAEVSAEARRRHSAVFDSGRSQGVQRAIAIVVLVLGIGLWIVNGDLRSTYVEHLPSPTAPIATGVLGSQQTSPGSKPGANETAIIVVSVLVFLLSYLLVFATHTGPRMRAVELRRREKTMMKRLDRTVDRSEKAIADYERARVEIEFERIRVEATIETARLPEDG